MEYPCFPQWLLLLISPPTVCKSCLLSIFSPTFVTCRHFDDSHCDRCELISHCGLICVSLISSFKHLAMCLLAICMSSLKKYLIRQEHYLPTFVIGCVELYELLYFPGGISGKEPAYQCRKHRRHVI